MPKLSLNLRADDILRRVRLNGTVIFQDSNAQAIAGATKNGSHLGPVLAIVWSQTTDFVAGQNCVEVDVEDVQQFITGLNVAGAVTFQPVVVSLPLCPRRLRGVPPSTVTADLSTGTTGNPPVDVSGANPKWFLVSSPASSSAAPAYVASFTSSTNGWPILNTTQPANWVHREPLAAVQPDLPGVYRYRLQFCVNTSPYSSTKLMLRYAADNSAVVQLNGNAITSCAGPWCFNTWQPSSSGLTINNPSLLTGINILDVVLTNTNPSTGTSRTGVIVDASVSGVCQ